MKAFVRIYALLVLALLTCAVSTRIMAASPAPTAPLIATASAVQFVQTDEFNGPFPSWKDVKRDYGAKGDGVADDSDAINKALADLRPGTHTFSVLYFPAGVYRVTKTVTDSPCKTHHEGSGIAVIGEDPRTTIIKWDGPDKGTVFSYTAWYSKVARLTIDGAGKADIAFLYCGEKFSTYNETSDMFFENAGTGLQMGGAGGDMGQAENMVHRCRFINCGFGLRTLNFNSLDIWIWNSLFQDCGSAIRNGAGNYNAYSCVFLRSKTCDMDTSNCESFTAVDNVSIGSAMFLDFSWAPGGLFGRTPISITGNRIYDWTGDKGAIKLGGGPTMLWGNTFRNRAGDPGADVILGGDQGFFGNTYGVATPHGSPVAVISQSGVYRPRAIMSNDTIAKRESIADPKPVLPDVPQHIARQVFEIAPDSGAVQIQAAINSAAALKIGQRPIVHLPRGQYKINQTLVVPTGTDMQIVGDGTMEGSTMLNWVGAKGQFLMRIEGPSEASLSDLYIQNNTGNGVAFENCDQPGLRFYADRLCAQGKTGVWVDGMDQSNVQFRCLGLNGSLHVTGGQNRVAGAPIKGVTSVFCTTPGVAAKAEFDISGGANAVLRTLYYDTGRVIPDVSMSGDGNFLLDSALCCATSSADIPTFDFNNFSGHALMTDCSPNELSGADVGLRTKLEGDCSKGSVLQFGNDMGMMHAHNPNDLLVNASVPKCQNAGSYLSVFENSSLQWPQELTRPDDVPVLDKWGSEYPGGAIMRSLNLLTEAAKPHTPGIGDNFHPRIHSVLVWVNGDISVLISGTSADAALASIPAPAPVPPAAPTPAPAAKPAGGV